MTAASYPVNNRQYTAFLPLEQEFIFEKDKNYLFDLSYLGMLDIQGAEGQDFLQGQLSCDVRDVTESQMHPGTLCNLKGRILALVDVLNWHGFHLILPQDILADTQRSLAKTALFSKVNIQSALSWHFYGFYLQNPADLIPFNLVLPSERFSMIHDETFCCYCIGSQFYILICLQEQASSLSSVFSKHQQWRGSLAWHALQLHQQRIEIYPESRGLFLPHRLELHLSDYLSFEKGCYKGQEIIARMHYRSKLKHEIKLFNIQTSELLQSGKKLFNADGGEEIGELLDFCPLGNHKYLCAMSILIEHPGTGLLEDHRHVVDLTSVYTNCL